MIKKKKNIPQDGENRKAENFPEQFTGGLLSQTRSGAGVYQTRE
jgi:hypothetical protein